MSSVLELMKRFHRDEQGAGPEMGTVLIVALVVIPLVIVIIMFGQEIATLFGDAWKKIKGNKPITPSFG